MRKFIKLEKKDKNFIKVFKMFKLNVLLLDQKAAKNRLPQSKRW